MPNNPLAEALAFGPPPVGESPQRVTLEPPRILRSNVRELKDGMRLLPGMAINFKGSGTIKMIDEDGDILINVTRIDGESGNSPDESREGPVVKPMESPSPS